MGDVCNLGFLNRKFHAAVEWNKRVLILGGYTQDEKPCVPSHIQVLFNGEWRCMKPTGKMFMTRAPIQ